MKGIWFGMWLALWAAQAFCAEWSLEVHNGSFERRDAVVHHAVTREWKRLFETDALAETTGGKAVAVPCIVDASCETPELVWFLPGKTAPDAVRTFALVPKRAEAVLASDLVCADDGTTIAVENSYFRLNQPTHGGGGFPRDITFVQSGCSDPHLYFLDRIVRAQGDRLAQYCAKDCVDAESRVVFKSPLRVTVETRTGYGTKSAETPGNPRAIYRFTYTAFSPVVEVSARYAKSDDGAWRERHFLHLTRADRHYSAFVTGDPLQTHVMQLKGEPSKAVSATQWAVMSDGTNACGTGFEGSVCWDASNEFVYYVRSATTTWEGRTHAFEGGLYFGPAKDGAWYSQWMGMERLPDIRFFRDKKAWVPAESDPVRGAYEIGNLALRVAFGGADEGFDCVGIENRLAGGGRFVRARDGTAGLWLMAFKTPMGLDGKQESVVLDNRSKPARVFAERTRDGMAFFWQGLDLPGEPGAVDVRAEVCLEPGMGSSAWRLSVENRSKHYGVWSTDYPLLRSVAKPGTADVLLPHGNWGGSLMRHYTGHFEGHYPSGQCPLQMLTFQLGEAGLYLAAHDGAARDKRVVVSREQDVTFRLLAENAGLAGAAGAPDYPVVIAAYEGDWWQAAKLYRTWALQQAWTAKGPIRQRTDCPMNLQNLGFWMLLNGKPEGVVRNMQEAERLFAGVSVGVHWYCWHRIPFDNSYPEYFPPLDGMADATHALVARGQTVMPYINARLWDRDIPSFKGARMSACKQPSGDIYVETYGSGRNLVPMCPYTKLWQQKVREVCHRLIGECGVNAIYLDQIGAAAPAACYDASHGHPVGGGRYWADGYRTLLTGVRAEATKAGVALTTENTAEPYMDTVDAYLAWSPRSESDVPLLPAVYSGYTIYFASPQSARDTEESFCVAQARDFLWGCQLGWNDPWILQEANRIKQQFQCELCRYRLAAKNFLVYGQLVDEVHPSAAVQEAKLVWNRNTPHTARLPEVMGTVWRDGAGRMAVFVVNASGSPQTFSFQIAPERWLGERGPWRLSLLTPEGEMPLERARDCGILLGDLPPHGIRAFVIDSEK